MIKRWDICPHLHAMSDFGIASEARKAEGYKYSRPHTNNAECYADICHRRGICIRARDIEQVIDNESTGK